MHGLRNCSLRTATGTLLPDSLGSSPILRLGRQPSFIFWQNN
jgi:hypothetical protein